MKSQFIRFQNDQVFSSLEVVVLVFRIIHILFLNTLFVYYFYNDNGYCQSIVREDYCKETQGFSIIHGFCDWHPEHRTCYYNSNDPTANYFGSLVLVILIFLGIIPLDFFIRHFIIQASVDLVETYNPKKHKREENQILLTEHTIEPWKGDTSVVVPLYLRKNPQQFLQVLSSSVEEYDDEMKLCQDKFTVMYRGARIERMIREIDFVSPEEELSIWLSKCRNDLWFPKEDLKIYGNVEGFSRLGFV